MGIFDKFKSKNDSCAEQEQYNTNSSDINTASTPTFDVSDVLYNWDCC